MSHFLIVGPPQSSLEKKYTRQLNSLLFANGCEQINDNKTQYLSDLFQSNLALYSQFTFDDHQQSLPEDNEFLMSIYENIGQGAQLIEKMRSHIKEKHRLLQKSIEKLANDACAALFAVYIKHYRRINLAKYEISRTDDRRPHSKLLSIFEYTNRVQMLFAKVRGQGGDCQELCNHIKTNSRFLLLSVKENHLIPIIYEDTKQQSGTNITLMDNEHNRRTLKLRRQDSRWTKAKLIFRMLRNTLQACIQLKKLMMSKKEMIDQKRDNEYVLHEIIDAYVYGDCYEGNMSTIIEEKKSKSEHMLQCMSRQYERSITRLITYRFSQAFLRKLFDVKDENRIRIIATIYLRHLRQINLDWLYLENIEASNSVLKEEISNSYYGCIKLVLSYLLQSNSSETMVLVSSMFNLLNLSYQSVDIYNLHRYQFIETFFTSFISLTKKFDDLTVLKTNFIEYNWFRLFTLRLCENIQIEEWNVFNSIGGKFNVQQITPDIITELINFYRTIMSLKSPWQSIATQLVIDSIVSNFNDFKSFDNIDKSQVIDFIASLCILGGYIQPYCLGSIVKIYVDDENRHEFHLGLITEVDINTRDLGTPEKSPYYVQYFHIDKAEWITADKLKLEINVPPPNPYLFPHADETIDLILDKFGSFIQLDTSTFDSILVLQLKRRCIGALYQLLNDRKLIEIFMQKSYASYLAKLAVCSLLLKTQLQLFDLRHFSKDHLEQYCLSLDNCEYLKQILGDDHEKENFHYDMKQNDTTDISSFSVWDNIPIHRDPKVADTLTASALKYNGWKVYASEAEIELFKRGRIGNDDMCVTPMPYRIPAAQTFQECGNNHKFLGRIDTRDDSSHGNFPTYILDNVQVSEGKWYFCVKLPLGELVQIGWATTGFSPDSRNGLGIGDDSHSWSYDGSRQVLFHDGSYDYPVDDIHWKQNDVCGCGIEIDSENTRIKYWLNGQCLGTAFAHQSYRGSSRLKCDMKPNGPNTSYFPGVSMQSYSYCSNCCEFILSPEDMIECPLPDGYKPLLLPKLVNTENSIVAYPFSAYLIGDDIENYIYTSRLSTSTIRLRDFVNENHLETSFILDNHHLILPENSGGLSFSIDNSTFPSTISFDFKFVTTGNNNSDCKTNIHLLTLNSLKLFSIEIPISNEVNEEIRIAIIFYPNEQQTKLYMNNKCRIFYGGFDYERTDNMILHILPNGGVAIRNLAIWKYALSEEHIHRLFTYGLSYVASDNEQLKEYRRQVNVFTFSENQQIFANELLVPFNQPFEENLWQKKKIQVENDESKYFKTIHRTNQSVVQLFGNKTYLVLDISTVHNSELTLILDIYVPNFPKNNEQLTLVMLNSKLSIWIAHDGRLFLSSDDRTLNMSTLHFPLNKCVRFVVSIDDNYGKMYLNGSLALENDKFTMKTNPIYLFREKNSTTNTTTEDILRIECKLIAFLNQAVSIDHAMESPEYSLESWLTPPLSLIVSRLTAIGYKETWITSVIKQSKTFTFQIADKLIREQKEQLIKNDLKNRREYYINILSQLAPSIDKEKLEDKIMFTKLENEVQLLAVTELMLTSWNDLQISTISIDDNDAMESESEDTKWFQKALRGLCTKNSFTEWIQNRSISNHNDELVYQLLDLNKTELEQSVMMTMAESSRKTIQKSIQYSHRQLSQKRYFDSRIACEQGLILIYARETVFNLLKIWSNNGQSLFQIEKLGDSQLIITLLRLMEYHYSSINDRINSNIDTLSIVAKSMLQAEMDILHKHIRAHDKMDDYLFQSKAPLLNQLQKDIIRQLILFLVQPSLLLKNYDEQTTIIDEQMIINQPNLTFILTIIKIFAELIANKSNHQQTDMNNMSSFNKRLQSILDACPKNIHNLFIMIDVIDTLTNKNKQTPMVEAFLAQSSSILGDNNVLTADDFEKSNSYFNPIVDKELMSFMNNNLSNDTSFNDFIISLPTEPEPNPIFFKIYPSLSTIPANCVQIRAKIIYQLNMICEKVLPIIDLSLVPRQSIVVDRLRNVKDYLLYWKKFELFEESLENTNIEYVRRPTIEFDLVKATMVSENGENTMFYQAYEQLHKDAYRSFRNEDDHLWEATYIGMYSIDAGGPYRDSITCICSDICSTRLPLFILCPNGRANIGLNRDRWIPNVFPPNESIPDTFKNQYRFVGQLMGMAIRKKHYLDFKFPIFLWKQLAREQVTIEDIEAIDIQCFKIIKEIQANFVQDEFVDINVDINYLFSSIMSELRFEVINSAGQSYELIPGGKEITLTATNFKDYCTKYHEYHLNEFNRQIEFIRQGLYSVVPCYYLSLFTAGELEEAVCGKGHIDIELLKRNTHYGDSNNQDLPHIERFWTVLSEMFNEEQKKSFIIFVWGRSTLPRSNEDFTCKFCINSYYASPDEVDKVLPQSHTCTFTLDLPEYSTTDIMYQRLNYAITNCSSIDGDG
ncbi:unnamed protein product [Rotaria sordida]|uniref:Uncharacterized protein n=1 Tax=Rotaria sordida TaxID=392033 RepID=A0A814HF60_9BILA|nr:unnamed protein product [Rotaria sordida]